MVGRVLGLGLHALAANPGDTEIGLVHGKQDGGWEVLVSAIFWGAWGDKMRPLLGRLSSQGCHSAVCGVSLLILGTRVTALSGTDFGIPSLWGHFPDLGQGVLGAIVPWHGFYFLVHLPSVFTSPVPGTALRNACHGQGDRERRWGEVLRASVPLLQGRRKASQRRGDDCAGVNSAAVGIGFQESGTAGTELWMPANLFWELAGIRTRLVPLRNGDWFGKRGRERQLRLASFVEASCFILQASAWKS